MQKVRLIDEERSWVARQLLGDRLLQIGNGPLPLDAQLFRQLLNEEARCDIARTEDSNGSRLHLLQSVLGETA